MKPARFAHGAVAAGGACQCPKCQGHVTRTARRPVDRLIDLFTPVYRFRCGNSACRWEGNLAHLRLPLRGAR